MNIVVISGNLTRDVELRYAPSGAAVGNVNIACNRKWKDQAGELKEEVSFFGVTIFGKQAETVAQYFKKGSPILIHGRLKQEVWDDKQTGKKRDKTVILMEAFEFMGGKREGGTPPARQEANSSPKPSGGAIPSEAAGESEDSSVPF